MPKNEAKDLVFIVSGGRTGTTFFGDYRITQLADTDIDTIRTNTAETELAGRQSWREVEF